MGSSRVAGSESPPGRSERLCAVLAFLGALTVRFLPFSDDVFQPAGVVPWRCPDVYYHLHRIDVAARSWPRFPEFDLWRNYPDGAYSLWSPLFEIVPVTVSAWTGIAPIVVGVWWPALLGALAIFPLLDILRRLQGPSAWLGVALFAVLPGSVSFAFLGRADHHVGEVWMQLWVYALTLRAFADLDREARVGAGRAVWLGVVMGLSLWMWRGSVVFLVVPAAVGLLMVTAARSDSTRQVVSRFWMLAFGAAVLTTAPYGVLNVARGRDAFSPYYLSLLQPAMLLVWALLLPVAQQIGETGFRPRPMLRARVVLASLAVAVISVVSADGLRRGTAFLTGVGDAWSATIVESQPLWSGGVPTLFVIEQLGFAPFLLLAVVPLQLVALFRRRPPSAVAAFVALATLCATALVFLQVRFVYYAAPLVAAIPGGLWCALRPRGRASQWLGLGLGLALLWPATRFWAPVFDGDPRSQMGPLVLEPWLREMLVEISEATPSAGDVHRPDLRPQYCILAPWDLGNFLQTVAERPVLASSGGPHETPAYEDTARFQQQFTLESEASELMASRGCRYAITEYRGEEPDSSALGHDLFARRLHASDGSDAPAHAGAGRFRWRFESSDRPGSGAHRYKVYEFVAGALLRFVAGSTAFVQTAVQGPHRRFVYRRALHPAKGGGLEVRVSQPGMYAVLDAGGVVLGSIQVSEQAVTQGRTLTLAGLP